ncbi:MAG TPA: stage II sporulation protein D, partial [Anaerovoracaceae bacterium]|nr:stage II sporulation protein D [Anaerovoracaceae bacterium]
MKIRIHKRKKRFKKRDYRLFKVISVIISFMVFCLILMPLLFVKSCSEERNNYSEHNHESIEISLYRQKEGKVIKLDLETYVVGVVAGEMPSSFEPEALKAQAVAARTYGISKILRGEEFGNSKDHISAPLCDGTHCQVYRSEEELFALKGEHWMADGWQRIKDAVADTAGEVMYYEEALVEQPLFHSSSGGRTENSEDVFVSALPYLRSVDSAFEGEAPHLNEKISVSMDTFRKKVRENYGAANIEPATIKILNRSEGGRVKEIQVGDKVLTGRNIRDLFGLRSANFTITFDGSEHIIFTTNGYGHGVGMSQWGANGMAKAGYGYKEILQHYYNGVK